MSPENQNQYSPRDYDAMKADAKAVAERVCDEANMKAQGGSTQQASAPTRPVAHTRYLPTPKSVVLELPVEDASKLRAFLGSVVYVDGTIQVLQTYPRNLGIGGWNGPRFTPEEVAATLTLIGRTLTTEARV